MLSVRLIVKHVRLILTHNLIIVNEVTGLDEDIDHVELYAEPARKKIKVNDLMNVFDQVHAEIGAKPILSKQLAKGALAWIPNEKLVNQIQDVEVHNTPLMNIVRNVHFSVSDK